MLFLNYPCGFNAVLGIGFRINSNRSWKHPIYVFMQFLLLRLCHSWCECNLKDRHLSLKCCLHVTTYYSSPFLALYSCTSLRCVLKSWWIRKKEKIESKFFIYIVVIQQHTVITVKFLMFLKKNETLRHYQDYHRPQENCGPES